jgi:hypothetical protein
MKYIVDCVNEAAGMVRYFTQEVEADTPEQAVNKVNISFKNSGPGIFATGATEKQEQTKR